MTSMLLDTFLGRLRLEGVLTTRTALHVGAGGAGDPLATDAPVVRDAAGRPYIPGSSLKGVLRSATESLLRAARAPAPPVVGRLQACNQVAGKEQACVENTKANEIRERLTKEARLKGQDVDPRVVAEEVWTKSCFVCRLFGSPALASRVRFPDLALCGGEPLFDLRNGVGIDRDKELAAPGVLYDFEAVPPDTAFALTVIFDNPTDAEVGLLLYLFDQLEQGNLALGGKSSRGLGRVSIAWTSIVEMTLEKTNPFAAMLSSRDLLSVAAKPEEASPPGRTLPATGDAEAWEKLADLLEGMPTIDKSFLGKEGATVGLTRATLNERLGLGLEGKQAQKPWDAALERLVESGFLARRGETLLVAGRELPEETGESSTIDGQPPRLQPLIDRFAGAMGQLWEEAN